MKTGIRASPKDEGLALCSALASAQDFSTTHSFALSLTRSGESRGKAPLRKRYPITKIAVTVKNLERPAWGDLRPFTPATPLCLQGSVTSYFIIT